MSIDLNAQTTAARAWTARGVADAKQAAAERLQRMARAAIAEGSDNAGTLVEKAQRAEWAAESARFEADIAEQLAAEWSRPARWF
jgi:hypothetical protein